MADSGFIPICWFCKHFHAVAVESGQISRYGSWSCETYPEGIPVEVFEGWINHQYPYQKDNDIQFEKRNEADNFEKIALFLEAIDMNHDEFVEFIFKHYIQNDDFYRTEKGQQAIKEELAIRRKWGVPD